MKGGLVSMITLGRIYHINEPSKTCALFRIDLEVDLLKRQAYISVCA